MFTDQQLDDFRAYEQVRQSGLFNMLDPVAMLMADLDQESYVFVLEHYSELKDAAEKRA